MRSIETYILCCYAISNDAHHLFTIVLLNQKLIISNTICVCELVVFVLFEIQILLS